MSERLRSLRSRGVAGLLAAAGTVVLAAPPAQAGEPLLTVSLGHSSLITIGEGSSPVPGIPSVKIEVPSPKGEAPLAEVGIDEKGVTVTTPVTPPIEISAPKAALPPTPTVPAVPPPAAETVTGTSGGGSGGSGSGGGALATAAAVGAGTQPTGSGASGAAAARKPGGGKTGAKPASQAKGSGGGGAAVAGAALAAVSGARKAADSASPRHAGSSSGDPLSSIGGALPLPLPVPDWSKPIILLLALLAIAFGVRWRLATRRAGRLERRQGSLLRDIEVMQAALVPEVPEQLGGCPSPSPTARPRARPREATSMTCSRSGRTASR